MTDIVALIAKLEAATEGSRELDAEIQLALYFPKYAFPEKVLNRVPSDPQEAYGRLTHDGMGSGKTAPAYTTSLDAALTRVPEGWFLDLHDWTWAEEPCWNANLQRIHPIHTSVGSKGATAALALCVAALKAQFANIDSKEEA